MANAYELLGITNETDEKVLIVDSDLRVISIPKGITNIGVESDDNVLALHFRLPRYFGDVDLSTFSIYVNYENAKDGGDIYDVKDPVIGEDAIEFDWLVGRFAVAYKGNVDFSLCLKEVEDGIVIREFNTTLATLPVLKGLETGERVLQEYPDILEQWKHELFGSASSIEADIRAAGDEQIAAIGKAVGDYIVEHDDELKGPEGKKGDAFTYEDFTPEQLESLKGPKGDAFTYEDFTEEQLAELKGDKGEAGSGLSVLDHYDTEELLRASITNPNPGDAYSVGITEPYDIYIYGKTAGWKNHGPLQGAKGDAFTYEDFTPEQLESLKGGNGSTPVKGKDYWTESDKTEIVNDVLAALPAAESMSV